MRLHLPPHRLLFLVLLVSALAHHVRVAQGRLIVVGVRDTGGFQHPWNSAVDYPQWEKNTVLVIGNSVVFEFPPEDAVFSFSSQEAFSACAYADAALLCSGAQGGGRQCTAAVGETPQYFASTPRNCRLGQKVTVQGRPPRQARLLRRVLDEAPPPVPALPTGSPAGLATGGSSGDGIPPALTVTSPSVIVTVGYAKGVYSYPWNPSVQWSAWAAGTKIYAGDVLSFKYPMYAEEVVRFPSFADYRACNYTAATVVCYDVWGAGSAGCTIKVGNTTAFYGSGLYGHCYNGQKFVLQPLLTRVTARAVTVGGPTPSFLWPWNPEVDLADWSKNNPVYKGDTLVFKYAKYADDVYVVPTLTDYTNCDYRNFVSYCNGTDGTGNGCESDPVTSTTYFVSGFYTISTSHQFSGVGDFCAAAGTGASDTAISVLYLSAVSSVVPISPRFIFSWPPRSASAAAGDAASPAFSAGGTGEGFVGGGQAADGRAEFRTMVLGTAPPGQTIVVVSSRKDDSEASNFGDSAVGSGIRGKGPFEDDALAAGESEGGVGGGGGDTGSIAKGAGETGAAADATVEAAAAAETGEGTSGGDTLVGVQGKVSAEPEGDTGDSFPTTESLSTGRTDLPPLLNITDRIPGSRLSTKRQVDAFRARWRCISESGRWEMDETPRPLPWALTNYTFGGCDVVFTRRRKTHLAGVLADAVALGGGKNIAFIGDSLTGQMHTSFFNHMRMAQRNPSESNSNGDSSSTSSTGRVEGRTAVEQRPYDQLCCGGVLQQNPTLGEWQVCEGAAFCSSGQEVRREQEEARVAGVAWKDGKAGSFIADFIRNDFLTVVDHPRWNLDTFAVELPFLGYMSGNRCDVMRPESEMDGTVNKSKKRNRRQMREKRNRKKGVRGVGADVGSGLGFVDEAKPAANLTANLPSAAALYKRYDILVMNRGAHYAGDDVFVPELRETILALRTRFPDALIIYRNTPPGHANCTQYWEPVSKRQAPETLPYNWGDFVRQNEMAREIVEAAGAVYLDVDTMTSLRADGHVGKNRRYKVDCLHYCLPGPIDLWTKMLYNVLLELL
ncbi:unnamed protein product [Closterium sp. NIES-64]|nr:unnamed protein product [Closterium sp. NIES-64]